MRIEILAPLTMKRNGQTFTIEAGDTIDLPSDQAMRLCSRARGKVWPLPDGDDWLSRWQAITTVTFGIQRDDQRYEPVLKILDRLDNHFANDDRNAFHRCTQKLRDVMHSRDIHTNQPAMPV